MKFLSDMQNVFKIYTLQNCANEKIRLGDIRYQRTDTYFNCWHVANVAAGD